MLRTPAEMKGELFVSEVNSKRKTLHLMFASRSYKQRFFIVECRETFFGCEVKLLPFFPLDGATELDNIVLIGAVRVFFNLLYFCSQLVLYGSVATIAQETSR